MQEQLTFNDLPKVLTQVLNKVERLETVMESIRKELTHKDKPGDGHIPMNIDEACEFLKMKKSTMYYHIERGNIPATKSGKNYLLFRDELVHWMESGRKNPVSKTAEELNQSFLETNRRKPKGFRL